MKKLLLFALLLSGILAAAQNQPNTFNYVCDDNNDGFASFYMLEIGSEISGNNPNLIVTHHETQSDAMSNVNPLPGMYTNVIQGTQTVFARVFDTVTGNAQVIAYQLHVSPRPTAFSFTASLCDDDNDGFVVINLSSFDTQFTVPGTFNFVSYHVSLSEAELGAGPITGTTNVANNQMLFVRVEDINTGCYTVTQFFIFLSSCQGQPGQPANLTACTDGSGIACFDLTQNTSAVLGNSNPAAYSVTYHASQVDADAAANPLSSNYCPPTSPFTVYARLSANSGGGYAIVSFTLTSATFQNATAPLQTMIQCDDNNDGLILFDLTTVQAQINNTNALSYYTNLPNAQEMNNPIANPGAFTVPVGGPITTIFIREIVVGGCDIIYTVQLQTLFNCNAAAACSSANSLCSSLGIPFSNTVDGPSSGQADCLGTTPNPTWFYLPISLSGTINLTMSQVNLVSNPIDVDFILYGPFTNQITPCSNPTLLAANVVGCSYSAAATETVSIVNAQPGQFYLLMITNFSNQQGLITINQTNIAQPGSGQIDCSGLRLQAFMDANSNGTKDNGEQNFPLGQFHYEKNDNGTVHNITAPAGIYDIYDTNASNSYDVSFTVDPAYAAMYGVSPASYSNLSITVGSGMVLYNFPVTSVQPYADLAVAIIPLSAPRPGFTYQNKIIYTNLGNQTIAAGTITYTKDSNVTITGNTQTGTVATTTGFTYDFANLAPFETRTMTVTMQVPTIPTVNAGQFLSCSASIVPVSGDIVPENNNSVSSQMVINAYDPNDKMEAHGDRILHATFTSNDYLYYTIRFENTGNASAINVRVNDVLDPQLDETSIRMVSASHTYEMDRVGNNVNWTFDNILLPVSIANTTVGKGYITFKIKPKPGYAVGDIINNAASIYFDFNPAIVTNMFATEFWAPLAVDQFANTDFAFYPNPTSDVVTISALNTQSNIASVVVYDVLGKTMLSQKANATTTTIDVAHLNAGMYFVEVVTENNMKVVKKLMVK